VSRAIRAELLKLTTAPTSAAFMAAMAALVVAATSLHAMAPAEDAVAGLDAQLDLVLTVGAGIGALFAAMAGAVAITGELRHGTIRPTLFADPDRTRLLVAKAAIQLAQGAVFGLVASGLAASVASLLLWARDVPVALDLSDFALLLAGSVAGSAVLAVLGLALGATVWRQMPVVAGLAVWSLFVESLLRGLAPEVGRFAPMSLALAVAGQPDDTAGSPVAALGLLGAMAAAALIVGQRALGRRDIV
jgi:hypothetical protein